jgi:hypothetical protein
MYSTSYYKEPLNFENTLYCVQKCVAGQIQKSVCTIKLMK